MPREHGQRTGLEPVLGGRDAVHISGMEPSLARNFAPIYGQFRVRGLEAPPVTGRRRPLVVVADRDPDTGELIQLIADSNGYDVRLTDNGTECIQLIRALRPDLIVMNIRLAGISGLELMRRIREDIDPETRALPMLVMEVYGHVKSVMEAFEAGADDYLEKPYELHAMLRCWRRLTTAVRRPSPLSAMQSEDAKIRQVALSFLLKNRPENLVDGLADLMPVVKTDVGLQIRWALRQLGTEEAISVLDQRAGAPRHGSE